MCSGRKILNARSFTVLVSGFTNKICRKEIFSFNPEASKYLKCKSVGGMEKPMIIIRVAVFSLSTAQLEISPAQRAGIAPQNIIRPEGTAENPHPSVVPRGPQIFYHVTYPGRLASE
jgi:hypothetical protein